VSDLYVQLSVRHLGKKKILNNLPGIRSIAIDFAGIDPITKPFWTHSSIS
jgi:succinate dehydrogenase / fumarate reductase flavoprotein subunit